MKSIAGAILILASALFAYGGLMTHSADRASVFGILWLIHLLLGLGYLFIAKDKSGE